MCQTNRGRSFGPCKIGCDRVGRAGAGSFMELGEVPKLASCRIGFNSVGVLGFWKPGSAEEDQGRKTGLWLWAVAVGA